MISRLTSSVAADPRSAVLGCYEDAARRRGITREEVAQVYDAIDMDAIARRSRYASDMINVIHAEMAKGLSAIIERRAKDERLADADRLWGVLS